MKHIRLLLILSFVFAGAPFCGAARSTNVLAHLDPVPPFPELSAAAKAAHIPLDDIRPSTDTDLLPGDCVTALLTLHEKGNRRTQWLVYFQVIADPPSVVPAKPEKPLVLYTGTGNKFEFPQSHATLRIRALGPFVNSESFWGEPVPKDKSSATSVNKSYLALGLDKGAAAVCRWNLAEGQTKVTNYDFWFSGKPPGSAGIAKNQKAAAALHVTADEERAVTAWYPALTSYFSAVGETPNLESIMWKVVSLPSMWSIVKHVGITAAIWVDPKSVSELALPPGWNMPPAPVYTVPMHVDLNHRRALDATLIVTVPRPPLLTCGGIIGFVAQNPNDSENYLTLRIVSAHCGDSVSEK